MFLFVFLFQRTLEVREHDKNCLNTRFTDPGGAVLRCPVGRPQCDVLEEVLDEQPLVWAQKQIHTGEQRNKHSRDQKRVDDHPAANLSLHARARRPPPPKCSFAQIREYAYGAVTQ